MKPTPSIVVLCDWVGYEYVGEEKEVYRLCEYDKVIHFIKDVISYVYPMERDEHDTQHIAYRC